MATVESQGTKFAAGDGNSPEVFNNVGEITSIEGLEGGQASVIDVSNLDSAAVEKRMGLPDEGQVTLQVNLDPTDTQQTLLRTRRAGRTRGNYRITLPDSPATVFNFAAYVLSFLKSIGVNQVVTATIVLEVDGPVT